MLNPDLGPLGEYPFARLVSILDGVEPPSELEPIAFSIGEPQMGPPPLFAETLAANATLWNKYPPPIGDAAFRGAVADWLVRRYDLPDGVLDPDRHVLPVAGTREPLYHMGFLTAQAEKGCGNPAVCMPNPFYFSYRGAALVGRAEPVYLPALAENDFLPDLDALSEDLLARTTLFFLATPTNPQGTIASPDYLRRLIGLARKYDFLLVIDECYAEIYRGAPPVGGLAVAAGMGAGFDNVVVFHSLSKRSSAPGARSGFIAGDERIIKRHGQLVSMGGAPIPLPVLHASTALWRDEAHVIEARARYEKNFRSAEEILGGRPGVSIPPAGFFLWINVGDGEAAAQRLWGEAAVKALPGNLMARVDSSGSNPGDPYLRIALVYDPETTREGLERVARVLW